MNEPIGDDSSLAEKIKIMAQLKNELDMHSAQMKAIRKDFDRLQKDVYEEMDTLEIQNMKVDSEQGPVTAYQTTTVRAKVADPEAFSKWADENENSGSNAFRMWSSQKVTSAVRELLKSEDASLPDGLEVNEFTEVRIRRG